MSFDTALDFVKTTGLASIAALSSGLFLRRITRGKSEKRLEQERKERLIVITGCDSGLGYSMAFWAATLGYTVLAGCLNENGEGPRKLQEKFPNQVIIASLNVTESSNLENFQKLCRDILEADGRKLELWAIIANAAVCTMGEFLWQTQQQKEYQMDVNYWGTVNFITEFRALLFQTKARVIVISSDCSDYPLPFLSAYCASKAALNSWTQAFRFEVGKYGIQVIAYQPRDFHAGSGLFANLEFQYKRMQEEMDETDKKYYGDYFEKFMKGKMTVFNPSKEASIQVMNSNHHRNSFIHILEDDISRVSVYRDFSFFEKVFHSLYSYLPQAFVDKLVNVLLNPQYKTIYWKRPDIQE